MLAVNDSQTNRIVTLRQICQNSIELQTAVRNIKRNHPASCELRQIEADCFLSQKMNRNGIGIKRIQNDEAVVMVRRILQLEPRVTKNNFDRSSGAFLQVSKILRRLRDADNCRIDLVESPVLIGTRVTCHRSGSQSDNSHIRREGVCVERLEDLSQWPITMKV